MPDGGIAKKRRENWSVPLNGLLSRARPALRGYVLRCRRMCWTSQSHGHTSGSLVNPRIGVIPNIYRAAIRRSMQLVSCNHAWNLFVIFPRMKQLHFSMSFNTILILNSTVIHLRVSQNCAYVASHYNTTCVRIRFYHFAYFNMIYTDIENINIYTKRELPRSYPWNLLKFSLLGGKIKLEKLKSAKLKLAHWLYKARVTLGGNRRIYLQKLRSPRFRRIASYSADSTVPSEFRLSGFNLWWDSDASGIKIYNERAKWIARAASRLVAPGPCDFRFGTTRGSCEKINFVGTSAFWFVHDFVRTYGITFEHDLSLAWTL